MAPQASTRLTYQDYLELPDDGKNYELIEGELILNPSPIPRHQIISGNLHLAVGMHLARHGGGIVIFSPIDVVLADDVVLQPDLIVICTERLSIMGRTNIQGAPNLVVEVLSDSTRRRDEIIKRRLYEQHGVDEYWIIDPVIDLVKIYRRDGTTFVRVAEISVESGGTMTTPLLPGFAVDVNAVFGV